MELKINKVKGAKEHCIACNSTENLYAVFGNVLCNKCMADLFWGKNECGTGGRLMLKKVAELTLDILDDHCGAIIDALEEKGFIVIEEKNGLVENHYSIAVKK